MEGLWCVCVTVICITEVGCVCVIFACVCILRGGRGTEEYQDRFHTVAQNVYKRNSAVE